MTPDKFGGIHVGHYALDYLEKDCLPNMLPYGNVRGRNYKQSQSQVDNLHFDVTSANVAIKAHKIAKTDHEAYLNTKAKYSHLDPKIRESPVFDLLCFILNGESKKI